MSHTTKYGNTYTDQEWKTVQKMYKQEGDEAASYFDILHKSIAKAAKILHNQFSDVPESSWRMALNNEYEMNAKEIQFTSEEKQQRFNDASKWIEKQLSQI